MTQCVALWRGNGRSKAVSVIGANRRVNDWRPSEVILAAGQFMLTSYYVHMHSWLLLLARVIDHVDLQTFGFAFVWFTYLL